MTHPPEILHTRALRLLRDIEKAGGVVTQERLDQLAEQLYASDMPYVERNDLVAIALELHVERNRGKAGEKAAPGGTSGAKRGTKSSNRETRTAPSRKATPEEGTPASNGKLRKLTRGETGSLAIEFFRSNPNGTGNACYDYLLTQGTPSMGRSSFVNGGWISRSRKAAMHSLPREPEPSKKRPGPQPRPEPAETADPLSGIAPPLKRIINRIREAPDRKAAFAVAAELHGAKLTDTTAAAVKAALDVHGPDPREDLIQSSPSTSIAGSAPSSEVEKQEPSPAVLLNPEEVATTPAPPEVLCFAAAPGVASVAELVAQLEADLAKLEGTAAAIRTALDVVRKYAA